MAHLQLPKADAVFRFACEDPNKEYKAVRASLAERKWVKVGRAASGTKDAPDLVWTLDERTIDHEKLSEEQCANHYRDIACLTTKAGLTRTMDDAPWCAAGAAADASTFFPRSYALDDEAHRAAFERDFRRTAACCALRSYVEDAAAPAARRLVDLCLRACGAWARDLAGDCDEGDDLLPNDWADRKSVV